MDERVIRWMKENKLVRIEVLKGRGIRQFINGRILQFDEEQYSILFYDDDHKKVENLKLTEIENIEAS